MKKQNRIGRLKLSNILFDLLNYGFLTGLTLVCLYPMVHVLFASVSEPEALLSHRGILLWPLGFTLKGYQTVFKNSGLVKGFQNTLLYVSLGTAVQMVMTVIGAYALSRRDLMLKKIVMFVITVTMFFGGGLIPWFLLMQRLGLYNNLWAMILPGAINTWNMIILRTGFQSLPYELEEAAIVDGASQAKILMRIVLPLAKPVLAVIFLYYMVGNWNSWFNAMVLLKDRSKYPLQLLLKELLVQDDTTASAGNGVSLSTITGYQELVKYCVIVVCTFPILCIYPFLQKYFVKGVFVGSIKG